ncbi:MAG: hypothetical protein ACRD51_08575 [Candidatus Acidiferrum sp.]
MADSDLVVFCRQVRSRSRENKQALELLHHHGNLPGNVIATLRQELDSMVRCIFLLSITDRQYRDRLIHDCVEGNLWRTKDGKHKVTDREMVDLSTKLHGWAQNVYAFGCAFIHLSPFHDHAARDPLDTLTSHDRSDIANYLRNYHGVVIGRDTKLRDIAHVLPAVFEKISENLECYVKDLEAGSDLR